MRHSTAGHPRVPAGRLASTPPIVTSAPLRRQGRGVGGGLWRWRQRRSCAARAGIAPEQRAAAVGRRRQARRQQVDREPRQTLRRGDDLQRFVPT